MSNVSLAVETILNDLSGKRVLEVGCGTAEFSLEAAKVAEHVDCIDLDGKRLLSEVSGNEKVSFWQMDASLMAFADASFDAAVMYNAAGHMGEKLPDVLGECLRVTRIGGTVYIISSWMLDKCAIEDAVLPYLRGQGLKHTKWDVQSLMLVRINRE